MSRDKVVFIGGSSSSGASLSADQTFTGQNTFNLFPIVPISTASASAAMVANTRYKYTLTADLTASSFTGTTEGSRIVVDLITCDGTHVFNFPASYREGDANSTTTSLTPSAGNHRVIFERVGSSWYYTDTLTTTNLTGYTADGTNLVGFLGVPQNSQSAAYTTVLADAGKEIYHPVGDANVRTYTIAANASVAYTIGTVIIFTNMSASAVTIAINSDTLYWFGTGGTGSRTLAQYGTAAARKLTSTTWGISGTNLT